MVGMELSGVEETQSMFRDFRDLWTQEITYVTGTNVEYSIHVELGTSRMEARPYLFRAAREVARDPSKHLRDPGSIEDLIAQVALAIERLAKEHVPVDTGNLMGSIRAERI